MILRLSSLFFAIAIVLIHNTTIAAPPPLPAGLEKKTTAPKVPPVPPDSAPSLPTGLSSPKTDAPPLPSGLTPTPTPELPQGLKKAPPLPEGLNKPTVTSDTTNSVEEFSLFSTEEPFVNFNGFVDLRGGVRTQNDPYEDQFSLGEIRWQLALQKDIGPVAVNVVSDFIYDAITITQDIDLRTGYGWIDLREANIAFSPLSFMDIKLGRQILTWGTGDLIFINDLFPKDWRAFLIGRDLEYLKAPADSLKSSFFSDYINLDFVYSPLFNPDRSITGERVSYYNPILGSLAGRNAIIVADIPDTPEYAMRLYKTIAGNEFALYGYYGFWKSPLGYNPFTNKARYPKMRSLGASLRGTIWQGIGNIEVGYYDSYEKDSSTNPYTPNSEARFLMGYEQEVIKNFSIGAQFYVEWMQDYQQYVNSVEAIGAQVLRDEVRLVLTNRLTLLTHQQNVIWSLFTFFSPTDLDAYFRPSVSYKATDSWLMELGGNFFVGKEIYTFFGQFVNDSNVYAAIRYSY